MIGCFGTLIGSLILPIILGAVAYALSGMEILFWVVSIAVFILELPGILIGGIFDGIGDFIHRENEYAQDRADYRELMQDISEDERMDKYLDKIDELSDNYVNKPDIYFDNRQVHFHNHSINNNRQRDAKGRFISSEKKK